ncbi:MAG TPA: DUF1998 domain-containing protein, partial [Armatimonadota bacterium]|nr:DUF1998 domain-containing protein [Armatimonadota bacterium]
AHVMEIGEERLLAAVRNELGPQVERLCSPPLRLDDGSGPMSPLDPASLIGVPVAAFPRWMRCPYCSLLAPLGTGLFQLKVDPYRPDRTRYVHASCKKAGQPPTVVPSRFLVACKAGHLDDFPWVEYVHHGATFCGAPVIRIREFGVSGEAADIQVECDTCKQTRRLSDAFGESAGNVLPRCRGRRPHLRDYAEAPCAEPLKTISLGASNSWFSLSLTALSIPQASNRLAQLVDEHWTTLEKAVSREVLAAFKAIGQLRPFAAFSDDEVWTAIEAKRAGGDTAAEEDRVDLKAPEWAVFSCPDPSLNSNDFMLTAVGVPAPYGSLLSQVVLVERLREVRALMGFTRLESPGDFGEQVEVPPEQRAPLSRRPPRWVPAAEVRGEGIFIQFDEAAVQSWCAEVDAKDREFFDAHRQWRSARRLPDPNQGYPGIRYLLLHTFSHALMRQLSLECGYAAASIRERIYSREPDLEGGPMAGILLYTAAPDSEGTLGGLVHLGAPERLGRHLAQALEQLQLCTSDPLCAEHHPLRDGVSLHGSACHACLFSPETSCERGNRYLDRSLLVRTFASQPHPYFSPGER